MLDGLHLAMGGFALEIGAAPAGCAVSNRVMRRTQPPVHLANSE